MKIFEIIENETSVCYGKTGHNKRETGHGKRATFQFEYDWKKNLTPPCKISACAQNNSL